MPTSKPASIISILVQVLKNGYYAEDREKHIQLITLAWYGNCKSR